MHSSIDTTSPAARNAIVDALRGLCILFVVFNHLGIRVPLKRTMLADYLPDWLLRGINWNGYESVFVFFVISGFLITRRSLDRWQSLDAIPPRTFYVLRATRIVPCLALVLLVLSALHCLSVPRFVIDGPGQSLAGALSSALGLYLNWYEGDTGYLPGGWDVLWSLSIEEAFYLAFPIVCIILGALRLRLAALLLLASSMPFVLTHLHAQPNEIWAEKAYLPGMSAIAIGVLTAIGARAIGRITQPFATACVVTGIAGIAATFFAGGSIYQVLGFSYVLVLALSTACVLLGAYQCKRGARWALRYFAWLCSCGRLSYEMYLFHMFAVFALVGVARASGLDGRWGFFWYLPTVALTWLFGWMIARWFSLPVESWLRRRYVRDGGHRLDVQTTSA